MSDSTPTRASWNEIVFAEFEAGKPRIADMFDRDALLVLGTTGARSGELRRTPLAYLTIDDQLVVIASAGGQEANPAWFFNLVANPEVTVRRWVGDEIENFEATATVPTGEERDRLWAEVLKVAPGFGDYQAKVSRTIPVVTLTR